MFAIPTILLHMFFKIDFQYAEFRKLDIYSGSANEFVFDLIKYPAKMYGSFSLNTAVFPTNSLLLVLLKRISPDSTVYFFLSFSSMSIYLRLPRSQSPA